MENIEQPLVSVIIPCYNSEEYISDCIESVLNQDYPLIEIIVVDDGSTDNSINEVLKFNNITLIRQENSGACVARNKGIEQSNGKYIKFLDSDDILNANVINVQVRLAEKLNNNVIVYGNYHILKNGKKKIKNTLLESGDQTAVMIMSSILTTTPMHRKTNLLDVGGFDVRLKNGQEWNLHIRLSDKGYLFYHHNHSIFQYRIHDSEHRVTIKRKLSTDEIEYNAFKLKVTREALEGDINSDINSAFALSYWWIGRAFYRNGNISKSKYYLNYAKELSKDYKRFWPAYYKTVNRLLGFEKSELIFKIYFLLKKSF